MTHFSIPNFGPIPYSPHKKEISKLSWNEDRRSQLNISIAIDNIVPPVAKASGYWYQFYQMNNS